MRKLVAPVLTFTTFSLALTAAYVAYPLATAWTIREAIREGDAAYLEHKVEWPRVRETLRSSMTRIAFDMPPVDAPQKVGLWKRFKAYIGSGAVNRFVEAYVTPQGLPKLFEYRQAYRHNISGEPDERTLPLATRLKTFWSRLKRAEFKSLTAFEVEMADRYDAGRRHVALLELQGTEWRLAELRVKETAEEDPALAAAILPTDR